MYYLNSRYYNPDWGRFINADGIVAVSGELLSTNMFAYCKNNPVNMQDPDGYREMIATGISDETDEQRAISIAMMNHTYDSETGAIYHNGVSFTERNESQVYNAPGGKVCTITNYSTIHFENSVAGEQAAAALNANMNRDANLQIALMAAVAGYGSLTLEGLLAKMSLAATTSASIGATLSDFSYKVHSGDTIKITTSGAGGGGPTRSGLSQTIEIFRADGTVDKGW